MATVKELEELIKAAKDFKEYQSIGNGAKLNCAVKCEKTPNTDRVKDVSYGEQGLKEYERPSEIYVAQ